VHPERLAQSRAHLTDNARHSHDFSALLMQSNREDHDHEMNFDGAKRFLDWLQGRCELDELLRQPGYQTIFEHSRRFAAGLTPEDIKTAVRQEPSPFLVYVAYRKICRPSKTRSAAWKRSRKAYSAKLQQLCRSSFRRKISNRLPYTL